VAMLWCAALSLPAMLLWIFEGQDREQQARRPSWLSEVEEFTDEVEV